MHNRFLPHILVWTVLLAALLPQISYAAGLENLKIGVVDLNKALNESAAGQRSKKILLAARNQKESELKAMEDEIKKLQAELKNNIMLTKDARSRKEKEISDKSRGLQFEVQKAQQDLKDQERKLTESIFIELRTVLEQVGKEDKFDLILEHNASQVILFHTVPFIDITDRVISKYNQFQKPN